MGSACLLWCVQPSQRVPGALGMVNADRLNVSFAASLICLGYIGLIVHEMWDARDARHPKIWWVTIQSKTQHVS